MAILGIDVGGSGIKGALVENGQLVTERLRIPTPEPSTPEAIADTLNEIVKSFNYKGPIGCGFPALILDGVVKTAANIHKTWIDVPAEKLFSQKTGQPVYLINDADAAGLAEIYYGAGKNKKGTIFMITIGTGIGTAIFINGQLVPNTELGHLKMYGKSAEKYCSDAVRTKKNLSWKQWAMRFNEYLAYIEFLFSPQLIILGGGASKKFDQFAPYLKTRAEIVPAELKNHAGIIGASVWAGSKASINTPSSTPQGNLL
ncbi:MAG TPA: polyphosphate glucokinase [Bacteroidales bacterium]|jgi:polyphosphate glucokinase|nr:polyphosphate glucokinase [Bacteroidales bacterium]HQN98217.1 ROK family protein [Bacteroidales bacterium]HQQ01595.1 ROK family protein [Bacteroidales bacterium]